MGDSPRLTATEYLDRVFDVIREEARDNAAFAARLVKALGGEVVFDTGQTAALLNPLEIAEQGGEVALRTQVANLEAGDVRAILKTHGLATPVDMRAKGADALIDMLVRRTLERLASRSS